MLIVEEGFPDFIEQAVNTELRRADIQTRIHGKGALPKAGEYTGEVDAARAREFPSRREAGRHRRAPTISAKADTLLGHKPAAVAIGRRPPAAPAEFLHRLPGAAGVRRAQAHPARDRPHAHLGRHRLPLVRDLRAVLDGQLDPRLRHVARERRRGRAEPEARPISVMGDGGFWHNGLITGVASNLFNKNDGVLIVMQNGYTSATGQQYMPSSATSRQGSAPGMDDRVDAALVRRQMAAQGAHLSASPTMVKTLKEAMRTPIAGLKVIIADGECQLARQRRVRAEDAVKLKAGERVVRTKFGVDDEICTGDHSCIRLSGCPSLTVKPSPDPLRTDPVADVIESCVGCGLCGEVAHAAVLCPSFYRAELIQNASAWDRFLHRMRRTVIGWLAPREVAA